MIKVGFTGTRNGMDELQYEKIKEFLDVEEKFEIHHGDCIGVDAEVAILAMALGHRVVSHPPIKNELRANAPCDEKREPLGYLARDRKIVDEVDMLIVVPYEQERQERGGTWYTHDYAVKQGLGVCIFFPDPVFADKKKKFGSGIF